MRSLRTTTTALQELFGIFFAFLSVCDMNCENLLLFDGENYYFLKKNNKKKTKL